MGDSRTYSSQFLDLSWAVASGFSIPLPVGLWWRGGDVHHLATDGGEVGVQECGRDDT